MENFILENFSNSKTPELSTIIINNLFALIIALFIMLVYKITFSGTTYSKRFNVSIGMITVITSIIMNVISNNIALSLGMVGALSIIRFRTAVKDIRDASFIFWAVAAGIGAGVSQYFSAGIGSITLAIFLLIMGQTTKNGTYILIIRTGEVNNVEKIIKGHFSDKAILKVKNFKNNISEYIYEVNEKNLLLSNQKANNDITELLKATNGILSIDLINQTENITRW